MKSFWKKYWPQICAGAAAIVIIATFAITLGAAIRGGTGEFEENVNGVVPIQTKFESFSYLCSVKHDEHLFVVYRGKSQGAMLHHPDCKCLEKGGAE